MIVKAFMVYKTYLTLFSALVVIAGFGMFPAGVDRFEYPKFVGLMVVGLILTFLVIFRAYEVVIPTLPVFARRSLAVFFLGQVVAFIFSTDISLSFAGSPYRYQGIVTILAYLAVLLCAIDFFNLTEHKITAGFFKWIGLCALVAALIGILSYTRIFFDPGFFEGRAYGTFGNPNYLASFLIAGLPCLFVWRSKLLVWFGGLTVVVALLLTGSRSAWIAGVIAFLVVGLLLYRQKSPKFIIGSISVAALLCAALAVGTIWHSDQAFIGRFSFKGAAEQSLKTRWDIWSSGLRMYMDSPFIGYGQDTTHLHLFEYLPASITNSGAETYVDRLHSEPLDILVTSGVLSLVGYMLLFIYTLYGMYKVANKEHTTRTDAAALCTVIALFVYQAVNFSTITTNILYYLALGYLLARISKTETETETKNRA